MAFTYTLAVLANPSDPLYPLHVVRLTIGDIVSTDAQFQDEEIDLFLDTSVTATAASIAAVRALIARYARYADKWVGDLKILASQRVKHYTDLLAELSSADVFIGTPSAGGVYVADKEAAVANSSLVQSFFSRNMDDNLEG